VTWNQVSHASDGVTPVTTWQTSEVTNVLGTQQAFGRTVTLLQRTRTSGQTINTEVDQAELLAEGIVTYQMDWEYSAPTSHSRGVTTYAAPFVDPSPAMNFGDPPRYVSSTATTTVTESSLGPAPAPTSYSFGAWISVFPPEPITVAAGTFNACRLEQRAAPGAAPNVITWFIPGGLGGIWVRQLIGTAVSVEAISVDTGASQ